MTLATTIQDRTNDGISIVEFLFAVMRSELEGFRPCHRLDAAKLLVKYDRDEARNFILDNPPEPSRLRHDSGSPDDTYFDTKLAKAIRESTEDGRTVCRFLINVMDGALSAFKPQHRITAARELLTRGFGKHATSRHSGGGRNPEKAETIASNPSTPSTQPTESQKSPNPTNQSSDDDGWAAFMEKVTPLLDEDDRRKAELAEQDPDPYVPDLSAFNEAWENSEKWFYDWKNSLDPEEYETIAAREIAEFNAMIDTKIERRKQIAAEREQREKEEAERLAQQKEVESKSAAEEPDEPGPPTRSQHKPKLMFVLGHSAYVDCGHPDCDLHEEDRNRWHGSVQYGAGPTSGHFP